MKTAAGDLGLRGILLLVIGCQLLLASCKTMGAGKAAKFEPGKQIDVLVTNIGPEGALLVVEKTGTPLDGVTFEIPDGALSKPAEVHVFYNTGEFKPATGEWSRVVIGLSAGPVNSFKKMVKIQVKYDARIHTGNVLVGFSIDPDQSGRVSGFQMLSEDDKTGVATFATLVPVQFTWIYTRVND